VLILYLVPVTRVENFSRRLHLQNTRQNHEQVQSRLEKLTESHKVCISN